jgi:hypothetical protein
LVPDAARILRLPVAVLRSWVCGRIEAEQRRFPAGEFETHGAGADRHFGFHSLIELFTIAQLRARGVPMANIREARAERLNRSRPSIP